MAKESQSKKKPIGDRVTPKRRQFRKGFRFKKRNVDVNVVADELYEVKNDDHGVWSENVVEKARPVDNPLHPFFTWDDTEAARLRRLDEARYLIRSIEVVYAEPKEHELESAEIVVREFQSLHLSGKSQPYYPIGTVMEDPELRQQLLNKAITLLRRWRRNYDGLRELSEVYEAIDMLD